MALFDSDGVWCYSTTMACGVAQQRWRAALLNTDGERHCLVTMAGGIV
jgi:hypothetical protein